jgi:hypothetical protein
VLYAFDLLEYDGSDLRRMPLETRKATLASEIDTAFASLAQKRSTRNARGAPGGARDLCVERDAKVGGLLRVTLI